MKQITTPFSIASILCLAYAKYICYLRFIVQRPDPHTFGLLTAILALLLAIVLFGIDRLLANSLTYRNKWIIESAIIMVVALFFLI